MRAFVDSWLFVVMCFVLLVAGCVVGAVTGSFAAYVVLDGLGLMGLLVGSIIEEGLI